MTREDSIRTKTWVTNDGRYLTVGEIADDHLRSIRRMLVTDLPPGYDQAAGQRIAHDWIARQESLQIQLGDDRLDYTVEMERDAYASAWIQIVDDELSRRSKHSPIDHRVDDLGTHYVYCACGHAEAHQGGDSMFEACERLNQHIRQSVGEEEWARRANKTTADLVALGQAASPKDPT